MSDMPFSMRHDAEFEIHHLLFQEEDEKDVSAVFFSNDYTTASRLVRVMRCAKELLDPKTPSFSFKSFPLASCSTCERLAGEVMLHFRTGLCDLEYSFPGYQFHPIVYNFFAAGTRTGMFDAAHWNLQGAFTKEHLAERLNCFRCQLIGLCNSPSFLRAQRARRSVQKEAQASVNDYINSLFSQRARWLVIRVDLSYRKDLGGSHDWSLASSHRARLTHYIRKELCTKLARPNAASPGYILKAEYGAEAGWHFHLLLFMDSLRFSHDVMIANMVGAHWRNAITEGSGRFFNCNMRRLNSLGEHVRLPGLGQCSWNDQAKLKAVREAASYLYKFDDYKRCVSSPEKTKFLTKGQNPKAVGIKLGRPRSKLLASSPVHKPTISANNAVANGEPLCSNSTFERAGRYQSHDKPLRIVLPDWEIPF